MIMYNTYTRILMLLMQCLLPVKLYRGYPDYFLVCYLRPFRGRVSNHVCIFVYLFVCSHNSNTIHIGSAIIFSREGRDLPIPHTSSKMVWIMIKTPQCFSNFFSKMSPPQIKNVKSIDVLFLHKVEPTFESVFVTNDTDTSWDSRIL